MLDKSHINIDTGFYGKYIAKVPHENLLTALEKSLASPECLDSFLLGKVGNRVYSPGKWTVKDIYQHIIDTERIMSYRALRLARQDKTVLPAYDENFFASNANAQNRSLDDLIEELKTVRKSSLLLFKSFAPEDLANRGICSGRELTPLALGFIILGHEIHHYTIIEERYFPLVT